MANIVKHRFASAKSDGADATQVQPSHWNDGHQLIGGNAGDVLTRDPTDASFGAKWSPTWIDMVYTSTNFVGGGGLIWTVEAGDVITFGYSLSGKFLTMAYWVQGTALTGSTSDSVYIATPFTPIRYTGTSCVTINNGAAGIGFARVAAGAAQIQISPPNFAWNLGDATIYGLISFPIA